MGSTRCVSALGSMALAAVLGACGSGGTEGGGGGAVVQSVGILYMVEDGNANGLWVIDTTTGLGTNIGNSGTISSTDGLTETNDPALLIGSQWNPIRRIASDGSGSTSTGGNQGAEGLAYDPASGTYYGILNNDFFTFDPVTGNRLLSLTDCPDDVEGLTYGGPDRLYGLTSNANVNGDLYYYTISTDTWTFIANTGISFDNAGLAYDPATGTLFAKGSQDMNLYRINPATAQATMVGNTGIPGGGGLAFVRIGAEYPGNALR